MGILTITLLLALCIQPIAEDGNKPYIVREEVKKILIKPTPKPKKNVKVVKQAKATSVPRTQESNRGDNGWDTYELTAYTDSYEGCGKVDGITASGRKVAYGQVAMDRSIPFGTRVLIDGMGEFVVTDRGGAIHGKRIDVFLPSRDQCIQFGRQYRKVKIIR